MYEAFFGLKERPFVTVPSPHAYFPGSAIEQARHGVTRIVQRGGGPSMVVGPVGTGKTLLCRLLARQLRQTFRVALLSSTRVCTRRGFLQAVLFELALPYRDLDEGELRLALTSHATSTELCPKGLVLLLDEADRLPRAVLEEVRMLTNVVRDEWPCIQPVLVGGRQLEELVSDPRLESLQQRIAGRFYLEPFSHDEAMAYVQSRLSSSGSFSHELFTPQALTAVYRATHGVPRLINQVCEHAMMLAFVGQVHQIDEEAIQDAWSDLQQLPTVEESFQDPSNVVEFGSLEEEDEESAPSAPAPDVILTEIEQHLQQLAYPDAMIPAESPSRVDDPGDASAPFTSYPGTPAPERQAEETDNKSPSEMPPLRDLEPTGEPRWPQPAAEQRESDELTLQPLPEFDAQFPDSPTHGDPFAWPTAIPDDQPSHPADQADWTQFDGRQEEQAPFSVSHPPAAESPFDWTADTPPSNGSPADPLPSTGPVQTRWPNDDYGRPWPGIETTTDCAPAESADKQTAAPGETSASLTLPPVIDSTPIDRVSSPEPDRPQQHLPSWSDASVQSAQAKPDEELTVEWTSSGETVPPPANDHGPAEPARQLTIHRDSEPYIATDPFCESFDEEEIVLETSSLPSPLSWQTLPTVESPWSRHIARQLEQLVGQTVSDEFIPSSEAASVARPITAQPAADMPTSAGTPTSADEDDIPGDPVWQDDAPIGDIWRDDAVSREPWEEHGHRWPLESADPTFVDSDKDDVRDDSELPDSGQPWDYARSSHPFDANLPAGTSGNTRPTRASKAWVDPDPEPAGAEWNLACSADALVFSATVAEVARVEQTDVYSVLLGSIPRSDDLSRLTQCLTASPAFQDAPLPSLKWLFSQLAGR